MNSDKTSKEEKGKMEERLESQPHESTYLSLTYEYGTHFAFPESMLKIMLPVVGDQITRLFKSGRKHPQECKAVRVDIDNKLSEIIRKW